MNRTSISLARIVALNVPRSWQEVVAVALEAGDLMKQSGTALTVDQCFISAAGGLQIHTAGWPSGAPGDALARLLETLLTGQAAPAELRALTEPDNADAGAGVDGLMKALAYFERPNRQADIAALATRAMAIEAQPIDADSELARLRAATAAGGGPQHSKPQPATARRPVKGALAALLLALLAAATATWYLNRPAAPTVPEAAAPPEGAPPEEPAAAPTSTVGSLVSAASEALTTVADAGLRAIGIEPSEPSPAATPAAPPAAPRPARRTPRAPAERAGSSATTVEPAPTPAPPTTGAELPVLIAEPDESAMAPEVAPGPFTEADAGVEPPVLVYPQLPSEPEPHPPANAPHFELLVNERGEVEQVRLRAADARLQDRMMVSAAKAWRFRPATKDGKPVRYRVRVPIPR